MRPVGPKGQETDVHYVVMTDLKGNVPVWILKQVGIYVLLCHLRRISHFALPTLGGEITAPQYLSSGQGR